MTPRGGRDAVEGWDFDPEGRPLLRVRVAAPPDDGAANAAVLALLAKRLSIPRSRIRILRGETARVKQLDIEGLEPAGLAAAFGAPPEKP